MHYPRIVPLGEALLPIEWPLRPFKAFWGYSAFGLYNFRLEDWKKFERQKWIYVGFKFRAKSMSLSLVEITQAKDNDTLLDLIKRSAFWIRQDSFFSTPEYGYRGRPGARGRRIARTLDQFFPYFDRIGFVQVSTTGACDSLVVTSQTI